MRTPDIMRFPQHNTTVQYTWNKKGTRYYCVNVADKYQFYFNNRKNLVEIDDLSMGTWDVFATKAEREWWLNLRGSKEVYEKHVLPSLKKFIEEMR